MAWNNIYIREVPYDTSIEDARIWNAFVEDMEREPEDEQDLLTWYESRLSSLC